MAFEIERKFLVANDGWKNAILGKTGIRDGLVFSANGRKVRVRISDADATITLKTAKCGITRGEYEYPIPLSDAEEIMRTMCDEHILEKIRYFVSHAGATWSVDVYGGLLEGIVIAEIELSHAGQTVDLPAWAGKEVTEDVRYRKVHLEAQRFIDRQHHSDARELFS